MTSKQQIKGDYSMTKRKDEWQTIGEVCVDSGHIVICDPYEADDVYERWDTLADKRDVIDDAANGIRSYELTNKYCCPIAVVAESGLGNGVYPVEARYEDLGEWGKRVAEIRIKFLPHPYFEAA
jgi:hypothetical protein